MTMGWYFKWGYIRKKQQTQHMEHFLTLPYTFSLYINNEVSSSGTKWVLAKEHILLRSLTRLDLSNPPHFP